MIQCAVCAHVCAAVCASHQAQGRSCHWGSPAQPSELPAQDEELGTGLPWGSVALASGKLHLAVSCRSLSLLMKLSASRMSFFLPLLLLV